MNPRIQHLINHPFEVQLSDVALLQDEIDKYPYFSTLRSLLLFALKESEHESYDNELKKTSIYSPSRVALYHYLQKEKQVPTIEETVEVVNVEPEPEIIVEVEVSEEIIESVQPEAQEEIKPQVEIGPSNQEMTFAQWLSFSKKENKKEEIPSEKDIKFQLIDEFIEKSPKIPQLKNSPETNPVSGKSSSANEYSDLMTETLAQIYTEQKKYDKAIRAYKILSLKYPEKSIFFADRIKEIEILKNHK